MKESYPVEVAEYVKAKELVDEPAFIWRVPYTLKKREIIIMAVKSRLKKKNHKYEIEIPRNVEHTYALDKANGDNYWKKTIFCVIQLNHLLKLQSIV